MAPSSFKKLGAAFAFASAGRVAAHSPDLLGSVVDAIFGEAPTPTHTHTTSYVTGTSTGVNEAGETTLVVVVDTTICPVTASEASESSALASETSPVPVPATATSETAAVAVTPSASGSGSAIISTTSLLHNASVPMTTSTIFTSHISTIATCPTAASDCTVGDVTTIVVAVSTTVCPVTATEGASHSNIRPTASGNVPGFGSSRSGALGATTLTTASSRSSSAVGSSSRSIRPQTTILSTPSVVMTTVSASSTTTSESEETTGTVLEMATGAPSDYSAVYTDATETVAVPSAAITPTTTNYNDALMSLASSVEASSAEQTSGGSDCQGMDCIVVQSNSGVKSKMNASGFALVALAGAVFLL